MARHIESTGGKLFAEALSFALAAHMARADAQAEVKALIETADANGQSLREAAGTSHPELDLSTIFDPVHQLGEAPAEARRFAKAARGERG